MSQHIFYHHYRLPPFSQTKYVPANVGKTYCFKCRNGKNGHDRVPAVVYQKNIWDLDFLESLQSGHKKEKTSSGRIETLKEVVKDMIIDSSSKTSAKLELIDDLQRLGIGCNFEKEIKATLRSLPINTEDDLRCTSLYFRLMRQHGYKVSQDQCVWNNVTDVFNCFKDEMGNFKPALCKDTRGILSLYEASNLGFEGEDILQEAIDFTVKYLKNMNTENVECSLLEDITHSIELPWHWRMPRLEARYYIGKYQEKEKPDPNLLELAMLEFNLSQSTYQNEISSLSRWWKHLGLSNKLSFSRDRLVESFLWAVGLADKYQYECCREWITKVVCLIVAIDDIYDIYGSIDELELFTAAVERWDLKAMAQLPDYMTICFLALFNTINDIVYRTYRDQNIDILPHMKQVWTDFCKAMLVEANWSKMGYIPSLTEYLENAWVSSGGTIGLILAFYVTEQPVTDEVLQSLTSNSDLIYYSCMIVRLCNDLASSSAELERGDVASAIQCYMHEANVSETTARDKIRSQISKMWKKLIKSASDAPFDDSFVKIVTDNARTALTIYQYGDGISVQDEEAKKRVTELLFKPIAIETHRMN